MYIILAKRSGDQHLIDFKSPNGTWHTWCEKSIGGNWAITTIAVDNIFPGICRTCKESMDKYRSRKDLRNLRNHHQSYLLSIVDFIHHDIISTQDKYYDAKSSNARRIKRYKNLLSKPNRPLKKYE
jgi:hypothetical protein